MTLRARSRRLLIGRHVTKRVKSCFSLGLVGKEFLKFRVSTGARKPAMPTYYTYFFTASAIKSDEGQTYHRFDWLEQKYKNFLQTRDREFFLDRHLQLTRREMNIFLDSWQGDGHKLGVGFKKNMPFTGF